MKKALFCIVAILTFVDFGNAQKNEIPESEFLAKQAFAAKSLESRNYRLSRVLEYFEHRDKTPRVAERHLKEVHLPNKWRTLDLSDYNEVKNRVERIWDGKYLYVKNGNGEWGRFDGGNTTGGRIESGRITNTYRKLGKTELNGVPAEQYSVQNLRVANKFSATDMVVVTYVRNTNYWFSIDGVLLKKIEETMIEGRQEMSRESTEIEYDPKITIEAPIK